MQATDETPSRFEKARAEALKWVDSLAGSDQMVVLQAGANTEVKQSATSEKAAFVAPCRLAPARIRPPVCVPALKMAESLVRDQTKRRNSSVQRRRRAGTERVRKQGPLPLVYHRVGKDSNNLGITGLDVRANPEDARQRAVYASVGNFSSNTPGNRGRAAAR